MPAVTGIKATEVAMIAVAIEKRTSVPAGPAVPSPSGLQTIMRVRSFVELAVGYGLSAETADATEQTSGDEAGYDDRIPRRGVSHCITPKRIAATL
jgi:hypothetical protein